MYVGIETLLQRFEVGEDGFVDKLKENSSGQSVMAKFGYFDQLTVNDYMPGQGIPPHVDTHSPF